MSDFEVHVRRGAHRARVTIWRAVLPSLLAVASVVSLIVALSVWRQAGTPASFDPGSQPAAAASASTSARPTNSSPTPSATSAPATSPAPTAQDSDAVRTPHPSGATMAVVVLNESSRKGLARQVADQLEAAGWTVAFVGNFRGAVPSTTVYYPAGHEADARRLAALLPGPDRVRPRFGNLSESRLTVIVTSSYAG